MSDRILIHYTGVHLGRSPRTVLRGGGRHVDWDRPVKSLPQDDARDLLSTPESFCCALPLPAAAAKYKLTPERLEELGVAGSVHVEEYRARGKDPELVLVEDPRTLAGLRAERQASKAEKATKKSKSTEKED